MSYTLDPRTDAWGQMNNWYGSQVSSLEDKQNAGLPDFRKFLQMTNQNTLGQQLDTTRRTAARSGQFSNPGFMSSLEKPAWNQYGANTVQSNAVVNQQETAYRMELQQMINRLREQYQAEYTAKMAANQNTTGLNSWLPEVQGIMSMLAPFLGGAAGAAGAAGASKAKGTNYEEQPRYA